MATLDKDAGLDPVERERLERIRREAQEKKSEQLGGKSAASPPGDSDTKRE